MSESGEEVRFSANGTNMVALEKPGPHTYEATWGGQKDTVSYTIASRSKSTFYSKLMDREWANRIGMTLVKVPGLLPGNRPGWVGKFEVTRDEYRKVMGGGPAGAAADARLPMADISYTDAAKFCDQLSTLESVNGPPDYKGHYRLPTEAEWKIFAAKASFSNAVYVAAAPAPVGSKGPSNDFGLCDVLGNVAEWLSSDDPVTKKYVGGSFNTTNKGFRKERAFTEAMEWDSKQHSEEVGLRVVYVPAQ